MGRIHEQIVSAEYGEGWQEVASAALVSLPTAARFENASLSLLAALPVGVAIAAQTTVTADGAPSVLLRQLGYGLEGTTHQDLVPLVAAAIAPGSRVLLGQAQESAAPLTRIVPTWQSASTDRVNPGPLVPDAGCRLQFPRSPAAWPWDLKRALAALVAVGGGTLEIGVRQVLRDARVTRAITAVQTELQAAAYGSPDDRSVQAGQLNCKAMLDNPALLGIEVSLSAHEDSPTLRHLVAMALFGTLAGEIEDEADGFDLRLLAGSLLVPGRIVPVREEMTELLSVRPLGNAGDSRKWRLGVAAGGMQVPLGDSDRARHVYAIGATGTGKSTLLKSLIMQDVHGGEGVILFDPHGDLAEDVLARIPENRRAEVIYADAAEINGGFAVDLLPFATDSTAFEIAADMLVSIFRGSLYAANPEGFGPMFDSYFRNALALLLEASREERCLANFTRVFNDPPFRRELLGRCTVPSVTGFWRSAIRTGGEAALENITPYITSKLTRFIASDHARSMFPIAEKCLDFDEAMERGRILILRCPKGALGEGLTELAMSASLMKIRAAAMARAGQENRRPVRVYIDEFQNCRGDSLQSLLAEGRKFGVSLVLANQSLGQIGGTDNASLGSATLANVGNLVTFRVGAADAIRLAPWLDAPDRWRELCQMPDFTMNARVLERGRPANYYGLSGPSPDEWQTN